MQSEVETQYFASLVRLRCDLTAEAILTQNFLRIDQIHKKLKYYILQILEFY